MKTTRNAYRILGLSMLAAGIAACTAPVDDAEIDADDADVSAEAAEQFSRTIVRLDDAGNEIVETVLVTRAQQLMEQEQRQLMLDGEYDGLGTASDAITHDTSCAGSSIWIFDQTNLAGNEICFYGPGIVDLHNYCRTYRCGARWDGAVRSFWAGADYGLFSIGSGFTCGGGQGTCGVFSAYQQNNPATSCEQQARFLGLQALCIPA